MLTTFWGIRDKHVQISHRHLARYLFDLELDLRQVKVFCMSEAQSIYDKNRRHASLVVGREMFTQFSFFLFIFSHYLPSLRRFFIPDFYLYVIPLAL